MKKKLTRSRDSRMISGVMGGIGEYFSVDPNLMRLGFVIFFLMTGVFPGAFIYLAAVFLIPEAHVVHRGSPNASDDVSPI